MTIFFKLKNICIILFMLFIVFNPIVSAKGASNGLTLWYSILIPSIFPSMLISKLLISLNFDDLINKWLYPLFKHIFPITKYCVFSIVFSIIAGLPTSSAIIYHLYKSEKISIYEAKYLIILTSNPSITFLINYVAYHILNKTFSLYIVLFIVYFSSYLSSYIYYICNKKYFKESAYLSFSDKKNNLAPQSTNEILLDSIKTITFVGIYVMIFSIIQQNVYYLFNNIYITTVIACVLEISSACNMCLSISELPIRFMFTMICSTFCGICAFFQINSVANIGKNNILFIIKYKMLSAACALSITIILLYVL